MAARGVYLQNEFDRLTYVAWRVATLSRVKVVPALKTLLRKSKPQKPKPQTPEQMFEILKMMTLAMGGKIINKTEH